MFDEAWPEEPPLLWPGTEADCPPLDEDDELLLDDGDDGEGMLGELRPEEPLDGEGIDGEDGIEEEDCCCCGQPPMSKAQTAPTIVACAATTGRDLRER